MSKPDDIPQDVWDAARNAFAGYGRAGEYAETVAIYERIARAILAAKAEERHSCLHLVEDYTSHPNELAAFIAAEIAEAIRKRGDG